MKSKTVSVSPEDIDYAKFLAADLFHYMGAWSVSYDGSLPTIWCIGMTKAYADCRDRNGHPIKPIFEIVGEGPTPFAAYENARRQLLPKSHPERVRK